MPWRRMRAATRRARAAYTAARVLAPIPPRPMRAYRWSINVKLGLVLFAVLIAVASLLYTNRVVDQLRAREAFMVQLQARAYEELPRAALASVNPHADALVDLAAYLDAAPGLSVDRRARLAEAVAWAQTMPPPGEVGFINEHVIRPNLFEIPAVVTDAAGSPQFWRNVPVDSAAALTGIPETAAAHARLAALVAEMDAQHAPVPVVVNAGGMRIEQRIHYGESRLVRELRLFPYVQLLFVALFVFVGYLSLAYVRRSEQSGLWAGMAKEAAHQLGTPISSLMGWSELLRADALDATGRVEAYEEIDKDIARLTRVTGRFSSIGSVPRLDVQPLAPLLTGAADYLRRRIPSSRRVALTVDVPSDLRAPLNADLFEWVVENLVKNALDAMEKGDGPGSGSAAASGAAQGSGSIAITARRSGDRIVVDVRDTGKGIERRDLDNVFRPGFSTKKRGWGLGLSLARRIVEHYHGGRLRVAQSRTTGPETGTTFRIELPAG